jgi:hypothetical protein
LEFVKPLEVGWEPLHWCILSQTLLRNRKACHLFLVENGDVLVVSNTVRSLAKLGKSSRRFFGEIERKAAYLELKEETY